MDVHQETPEDDQDYALVVWPVEELVDCKALSTAPTIVDAIASADNEVTVSWTGSSTLYRVFRAFGGCGGPYEQVGETATSPLCRHRCLRRSHIWLFRPLRRSV